MRRLAAILLACSATIASAQSPVGGAVVLAKPWQDKARALYETAVEFPTVQGRGEAHKQMADWLAGEYRGNGWAAGDVQVLPYEASDEKKYAVVARWPAAKPSGKKPMLIIAHMDVVEAKRSDWELDPFQFVEKDGYFYGRGTADDKQGVIATTAALFKMRAEGFKPDRDIIVFYSDDEETDGIGARMAATDWRKFTDAEFALNADAGGGAWDASGRSLGFGIQTAEKIYQDYRFTATNRGGHSSRPRPDNAIYDLSRALLKLADHRFEPQLNETTRAYYTARAVQEGNSPLGAAMRAWLANPADAKAADFIEASELEVGTTRTRCVATMLDGGHAPNALPQKASANVNCRALPGSTEADLTKELQAVVGPEIKVTTVGPFKPSPPSPLREDVLGAYTSAVHSLYGPDIQVIPQMSTGATDGLFFRQVGIPVYGTDLTWGISPDDERAHGLDERMPVRAFYNAVAGWEMIFRELAG